VSFEHAKEDLGVEGFTCEPLPLNSSGLPALEPVQYARRTSQESELDDDGLRRLILELECDDEEAEAFWDYYLQCIRAGHSSDASWARAMAHVFNPSREQPRAKPTAMDSHPTPPRHQPVGGMSDGDDATGFFTSSSPLSLEAATTAPPRRIDAPAFKRSSRTAASPPAGPPVGGPGRVFPGEPGQRPGVPGSRWRLISATTKPPPRLSKIPTRPFVAGSRMPARPAPASPSGNVRMAPGFGSHTIANSPRAVICGNLR
jgi:hypothetical protein